MNENNMNKNKIILQYCPNFYKIINYDFERDSLTDKLINVYINAGFYCIYIKWKRGS